MQARTTRWRSTGRSDPYHPSGTPSTGTPRARLYYEELMGEEGFSSDSSLLYHRGVPSAIVAARSGSCPTRPGRPTIRSSRGTCRLHDLETGDRRGHRPAAGAGQQRRPDRLRRDRATGPSPYYRNAIGDECVYVEAGAGTVETVFGVLAYRAGDYVVIPRATTHRWVPAEPSRLYPIEANSHVAPPKRYLSRYGQLLEHAPYCERDLHGPDRAAAGRRPARHRRRGAGQAPHQRRASSAPG